MNITDELKEKAAQAEKIIYKYLPSDYEYQKTIIEAMNYSVKVGGKRLRPIIMMEAFRLFEEENRASGFDSACNRDSESKADETDFSMVEPFMAAIEMIHTYSLVHDDLPAMDDDMLRRGNPTTHAKFGEAMGVLAGDALLNYSMETALKAVLPGKCFMEMHDLGKNGSGKKASADAVSFNSSENGYGNNFEKTNRIIKALRILYDKAGINGMIGGQVADVLNEDNPGISSDMLDFIYEKKTACLLEASLMIGAALAGADDRQIDIMEKIGHDIGVAFQIEDDILDVVGDSEKTGKSTGQDQKNHKVTYVTILGMDKAKEKISAMTKEAENLLDGIIDEMEGKSRKAAGEFLKRLMDYLINRDY